jgi:hypothetical protein
VMCWAAKSDSPVALRGARDGRSDMAMMLGNRALPQAPTPPPPPMTDPTILTATPAPLSKERFYEAIEQSRRAERKPETKEEAAEAIRNELAGKNRTWREIMTAEPPRGYAARAEKKPIPDTPKVGPISDYPTLINTVSRGVQYGLGRFKTVEERGKEAYEKGEYQPDPAALRPPPPRETMAWIRRRQPSAGTRGR